MRARVLAMMAISVALTTSACSSGDPVVVQTPTESPTPTLPPAPDNVVLRQDVRALSIADDDVLTKRTGRLAMDEAAITDAAMALNDLLQTDFDDRNHGGSGKLGALASRLVEVDSSVASLLQSLADDTNPAMEVDATIRLGVDVTPRWAEVGLDVLRRDGTRSLVTLVLSLDTEAWELVLVGTGGEA